MSWLPLSSLEEFNKLADDGTKSFAIFKHSTRCSISTMAMNRMESQWDAFQGLPIYFLDLIAHRDVSAAIAERYQVEHQSPQLLVIKESNCIHHSSHSAIQPNHLAGELSFPLS